ncbi:hypothetical protein, partial [Dubosiella newyorkensis]|uniref:hypothetical protein n=1 Tax=Dubosiella newyorkensis TaxID=1862672 RepID=UPI0023F0298A
HPSRLNFIILEFTHTEKPEKTLFSQVFVRDNSKLLLVLYGLEFKFSVYVFFIFLEKKHKKTHRIVSLNHDKERTNRLWVLIMIYLLTSKRNT